MTCLIYTSLCLWKSYRNNILHLNCYYPETLQHWNCYPRTNSGLWRLGSPLCVHHSLQCREKSPLWSVGRFDRHLEGRDAKTSSRLSCLLENSCHTSLLASSPRETFETIPADFIPSILTAGEERPWAVRAGSRASAASMERLFWTI